METLIKRKGLLPSMPQKSVNNFFDDFNTRKLSDWTDKNFVETISKAPAVSLNKTDTNIEAELAASGIKKEDFKKNDSYARKQFNYRSFCRLPDL